MKPINRFRWWKRRLQNWKEHVGLFPYVVIEERWQQYGGPEEGGWWHSCSDPVEVKRVPWFVAGRLRRRWEEAIDGERERGYWFPKWDGIGDPDQGGRYEYKPGVVVSKEKPRPHPQGQVRYE